MALTDRLRALARFPKAATPVVSVYLATRWRDEDQRERVRIFLRNELRKARAADPGRRIGADLDWIEERGRHLCEQMELTDAGGVALFACASGGLRQVVPVRVPFENAFVVDDRPFLRPLAAVADDVPTALAVFVDGESARLIPLGPSGRGEEVALESEVEGRHRTGGWAALAQSRYQRHIETHREQHYQAVAAAIGQLADEQSVEQLVLAGEPRAVAMLREHLPEPIRRRIAGIVPAARYEPAAAIADRAAGLLGMNGEIGEDRAVDEVITDAATGARAVAGIPATLEAVNREAIQRLYLLKGFRERGRLCERCGTLTPEADVPCRFCGAPTREIELGEAMVERVLATGGAVTLVDGHGDLARRGGAGARLRYAA